MKKIITLASAVFLTAFCFVFANPGAANAGGYQCSGTWGGKTWYYETYRVGVPAPYSTGSFTFNNWANTGSDITISWTGPSSGYCMTAAEFTENMNWMYNSDAGAFWAENRNSWSRNLSCGNTHTYTKSTPTPVVNGVCSVAKNTCSTPGESVNRGENSSEFTWDCPGSNGGNTAQCSLDKNGGGGRNNNDRNPNDNSVNPNYAPICVARPDNVAVNNGVDMIVWTIFDKADPNSSPYNFAWSHPPLPSGAVFNNSNSAAVTMTSTNAFKLAQGQISAVVSAPGFSKSVVCPSASFVEGITATFTQPIVEPDDMCTLNWDKLDPVATPVCEIYNEQGEMKHTIIDFPEGSHEVEPNNKYKIVCKAAPSQDHPEQEAGTVESEFLSCIKKGQLIEI